jgi:hypothetical protein
MKHSVYIFPRDQLLNIGTFIGDSLIDRLNATIYAQHVGTWHAHLIVGPIHHDIADVSKCDKDAVRYGLRPGRPIWTDGYDKRFCFDERAALTRIAYVERHNEAMNWPAKPWPFITPFHPTTNHQPTSTPPHLAPGH